MEEEDIILFHHEGELKVGDVTRYTIEYGPDPHHASRRSIWLRVRNLELAALRAAYLNGPYTLYCDMRPGAYDELKPVERPEDEPKYENHVKAGQHFSAEMLIPADGQRCVWKVDVASEILFRQGASVKYEVIVGTTKAASKSHHAARHIQADPLAAEFKVNMQDTATLWRTPPPFPAKPLHLVVLTHGLVSNVTADMLYLKESLDRMALKSGENIICRGYTGNVCRTEKGVKFLGRRVGQWVQEDLIPTYKPDKVSFISHSLGGPIQTYALGYICNKDPHFFDNIQLEHFVTLASPMLGISSENPGYVRFALDFGVVGKTGRDLGLSWVANGKPLLERLPGPPVRDVLQRFKHRTVYANAVNDGIVPLRTSALLYLDWRAIGKANAAHNGSNAAHFNDNDGSTNSPQDSEGKKQEGNEGNTNFNLGSLVHKKTKKIITRTQTINHDPDSIGEAGADENDTSEEQLPRKTSLIESGMTLLLPPHPDREFIADPNSREDVIFHDRVYKPQELPKRRFKRKLTLSGSHHEIVEVARTEEKIARTYHDQMDWRKVLVQLLPDAHNNIVVRRRFSNAYGWPVIRHLAEMVATPSESVNGDESENGSTNEPESNQIDKGPDELVTIFSDESGTVKPGLRHARQSADSNSSNGSTVSVTSSYLASQKTFSDDNHHIYEASDTESSDPVAETAQSAAMLTL